MATVKESPYVGTAMKRAFAIAVIIITASLTAQSIPAPAQERGRGGTPPVRPEPLAMADHTGFESIFDGSSMKGWDGDPAFWRASNGVLIGQSSIENPVKQNTFVIWRGGAPKDFELKLEYRLSATNSGVQIRSVQLPAGPDIGKWVMKGYQADIDAANQFTGQIYEERGRGFLAMRGQATYIADDGHPKVIGNLQQTADELKALIRPGDWNQIHLIARGSTIIQILNGAVTSLVVDEDLKNRQLGGLLGFQMHVGPPMTVEFRNIWLKPL